MNGLDDLRGQSPELSEPILMYTDIGAAGWTLKGAIQPHVDLYVSMHTFREVQRSFPYLVSKEFASGGGDVRAAKSCLDRVLSLFT